MDSAHDPFRDIDAEIASTLIESAENEAYAEDLLTEIVAGEELFIAALKANGSDMSMVIAARAQYGDQAAFTQGLDPETACKAFLVMHMAGLLALHTNQPKMHTRKDAEAEILLDPRISTEEKAAWLGAISITFHGNGLDSSIPEDYAYPDAFASKKVQETLITNLTRFRLDTVRTKFLELLATGVIPHHDDDETLCNALQFGLADMQEAATMVAFREANLSIARKLATIQGWDAELFESVVSLLKLSLG
jgi:hypothetical protein